MKMIWSRDRKRKEERLETRRTSQKYSSYHDMRLNASKSETIYYYVNAVNTAVLFYVMQLRPKLPMNSKVYNEIGSNNTGSVFL
jgi:hypothetical protein